MPETERFVEVALVVVPEVAVRFKVEMVPVAVMDETETILPEKIAFPWTANLLLGVVVPTPTFPEIFSITKAPDFTFNPPAMVEVDVLVIVRLVTVVVPPSNPPPAPQLMHTLPTLKLPTTFTLPEKVEVAVVP